jgi:proline iminopeptidase
METTYRIQTLDYDTLLYCRVIGSGQPLIVLHGGPDFDHSYLLPELDRLSSSFRLIYYDQRGRGLSGGNVQPEQVSLASEMEDLEALRTFFELEKAAILGHSWGAVLALEYATRFPQRVSHLVLMNPAPASHADYEDFQQERSQTTPGDLEKMQALSTTEDYLAGELETESEYYRIHFASTLRQPDLLEKLIENLRVNISPAGILRARAIEERLYAETWNIDGYNLLPRLTQLDIPTLLIHGDYDFVPVKCAEHIARAIPGAHLVELKDCGHFAYLERPEEVYREIGEFFEL